MSRTARIALGCIVGSASFLAFAACSSDDDRTKSEGAGVNVGGAAGAAGGSGLVVGGRAGAGGKPSGTAGASGNAGTGGQGGAAGKANAAGNAGAAGVAAAGTGGVGGTAGNAGSAGNAGTAGQAGQSGSAGTSGQGGASGFAGASGQAGSSGQSGASGAGGDAGQSGAAGAGGAAGQGAAGGAGGQGGAGMGGQSGAGIGGGAGSAAACTEGAVMACYEGTPGSKGIGPCAEGKSTCTGGTWGPCNGQVLPTAERPNGLDDDCDVTVDEDVPIPIGSAVSSFGPAGNYNTGEFNAFDVRCPGQQVLVGIRAFVAAPVSLVNAVTPLCAGLDKVPKANIAPATHVLAWSELGLAAPRIGGQQTKSVDLLCPVGKIVSTVHAIAGGAVEQLELTCAELRWSSGGGFSAIPDTTTLNQGQGVVTSQTLFATCPAGTAFTNVFGAWRFDVHAIGFRCSPLTVTP